MTSKIPIKIVKVLEYSSPKISATISVCLGTKFKILHTKPLIIQTIAINAVSVK